jgi:hypothetical protein
MPVLQSFMQFIKTQTTIEFIKSMIMCFGAPVISGLRCAILLNLSRPGEDMRSRWESARSEISAMTPVEFAEISATERSVLVMVYRPELMLRAIEPDEIRKFLSRLGYESFDSASSCIARLKERFKSEVPHEMGIFLGYPLEDVLGFIDNGGRNFKYLGYWKVYGDKRSAIEKFREYRKAETESAMCLLTKAGAAGFEKAERSGQFLFSR